MTPARPFSRLLPMAGLAVLLLTQSGCFTLMTATACVASRAKGCGSAVGAAVAVDAMVLEAAAESSTPSSYECTAYDEYGYCID